MSILITQYQNYLTKNPTSKLTYDEWLDFKTHEWTNEVWVPAVSDNFQIESDDILEDDLLN
jgi:hypothetical protein